MITTKEKYWRYSQIALILVLGVILMKEFWVFSGGFLGAFTLYVLVRNQMNRLVEKRKWNKNLAATFILLEVIVCFLVPIAVVIGLLIKVFENVALNTEDILVSAHRLIDFLQEKLDLDLLSADSLKYMSAYGTRIGKILVGEVSSFFINAFILLFVLFFMLVSSKPMEKYLFELMPFNETNKRHLATKIKDLVISNAIGIPLLAVAQGITAIVGYTALGTPFPFLFGLLTCFATVIPLFGTALVWVPLAIYMGVTGDVVHAIGLALFGLVIISNIDNLFRFLLQKKMADVHPLITVFGVIIGLSMYGFWGIIFGPVVLSVFFLLVDIFKKEYLDDKPKKSLM